MDEEEIEEDEDTINICREILVEPLSENDV